MKWYNVEVENGGEEKSLKTFLEMHRIKFETSGVGDMAHFEILASEADVESINWWRYAYDRMFN